jgi:hypothetical protein
VPQSARVRSIVHWKDDSAPANTPSTPTTAGKFVDLNKPDANGKYACAECDVPGTCGFDEMMCVDCTNKQTTKQIAGSIPRVVNTTPIDKQMDFLDKDAGPEPMTRKGQIVDNPEIDICEACNMTDRVGDFVNPLMGFVCKDCLKNAFSTFLCPHCSAELGKFPPEPLAFNASPEESDDPASADWQCTQCKQELNTAEPPRSFKGTHPFDLAELIWDTVDWGGEDGVGSVEDEDAEEGEHASLLRQFREAADGFD